MLREHPAVREVVVLAREDAHGEKRLVAYVVASESPARPAASDLRRFLRGQAARIYDAYGVRGAGRASADAQRQSGPRRAAGARPSLARTGRSLRHAAHRHRGVAGRNLGSGPRHRTGRCYTTISSSSAAILFWRLRSFPEFVTPSEWKCRCAGCSSCPPLLAWPKDIEVARQAGQKLQAPPIRPLRATETCRFRLRSSGCGSSISWRRATLPTISPPPFALRDR